MSLAIRDRRDNLRHLDAGTFGNHVRVWPDRDALAASGYAGPVSIRHFRPGFHTVYYVPQERLADELAALAARGHREDELYYNESVPDQHLILQGELYGRHLWYATTPTAMKRGLATAGRFADGAATEALLRWALNDSSHADFEELRDAFPEHAIEFSAYSICLGNCPHRNTLIWEVRRF